MLWVLNYSDGTHSLLEIAERANLEFSIVRRAADALLSADLLAESLWSLRCWCHTMNAIQINPKLSDEERRARLYQGDLFVYSATPGTRALCDLAKAMAEEAFAPHAPQQAQYHFPVEEYVAILTKLKPAFIHHPRCKELIRQMFEELGMAPEQSYFDVPRLRTMTHGDYLKAGLAYAFHAHRDTWFSAPAAQINWWLPVYDICPENTIAFYPKYNSQPLQNSSRIYNYYRWNRDSRGLAAQQVKTETRVQPQAEEPIDETNQVRVVCEAGGIVLFSGDYLHATVPNASGRTRFSIDFRTVDRSDVAAQRGAANLDSACPKPMVPIGYRPLLWHVIKYYAHYGHKDFVLCLGYKADVVKNYFLNYDECVSNDFVLAQGGQQLKLLSSDIHDWSITFVDTGINSNIGQRLKAIQPYVADE